MTQAGATDEELFSAIVPPNALIILDMSGSMNMDPAGFGYPFNVFPKAKIDIARNVIYDLLDANDDGKNSNNDAAYINSDDETSLNVNLGYMRFRNVIKDKDGKWHWDDGDPFNGDIKIFKNKTEIGSHYSDIWGQVNSETATGATPLGAALAEAKKYFLENVNPNDTAIACRQKFIILVTDGSDTVGCNGDGTEGQSDMWKRRMLTVQRAKEAYEAGIQVYAVGFGGDMPDNLKRTLNWVAKYGGTNNPLEDDSDSGNTTTAYAYNITEYLGRDAQNNDDACLTTASATTGDPASYPLSGYAFLANNADDLSQAIKTIISNIQQQSFTFTVPSIPSVRLIDKDVVYISSFVPNNTPFWKGSLKAYQLNADGTLPVDGNGKPDSSYNIWRRNTDEGAGEILKERKDSNPRNILVYVRGSINKFDNTILTDNDLNLGPETNSCNSECQKLISYVRGTDTYNVKGREDKNWKLGDIFHSNPVIVGTPSPFFEDEGYSGPGGFYERNKNRTKVIIAGANDGMLHAFNADTGDEAWAFIPNSVLKTLKSMKTAHTYYVDGTPKVADVWLI